METVKIKKTYFEINRGGSGIINCVQLSNGIKAAQKIFHPMNMDKLDEISLGKFRRRFIKEVLTQERLDSELFMPVLFHELTGEHPWFVMPEATRDYSAEIKLARDEGRTPKGIADILNALEHLHGIGYTHRDIKPQNILEHEGKWKLSDFGLIRNKSSILTNFSTSDGDRGGTEMYMAPEQFQDFKRVSHLADIYSFGAILHDIFSDGKRIPYSCLSNVSGQIGPIIKKCTEDDPRKRFQSIGELRSVLLTVLAKENISKDQKTDEIINQLSKLSQWKEQDFEQFCFSSSRLADPTPVYVELGKETLTELFQLDKYLWKQLMNNYLEWIAQTDFQFDYCDVLISRIQKINELSSEVDIKFKCINSAAFLAVKHNRWYVMHRVIRMINPEIDELLAQRLEIELQIDLKLKEKLSLCLEVIALPKTACHPLLIPHLS